MRFAWAFLLILCCSPAFAADVLTDAGQATVARVIDGDTVRLTDGRLVRLAGLNAPERPGATKGRTDPRFQVFGAESAAFLKTLLEGKPVRLRFGGAGRDRHGRMVAHVYREDGNGAETWVQGAMLAAGMARVYTFPDNRALAADMYAQEDNARAKGLGLWALAEYAVRGPSGLAGDKDTFQVVEGRVLDAARVKGTVYLNFGPDWRTDFTVRLKKAGQKLFAKAGVDPLAFEGRRVQVRGWIGARNGPMITATHPEQIRLLAD